MTTVNTSWIRNRQRQSSTNLSASAAAHLGDAQQAAQFKPGSELLRSRSRTSDAMSGTAGTYPIGRDQAVSTVFATTKVAGAPGGAALARVKPWGSTGRFADLAISDDGTYAVTVGVNGATLASSSNGGLTWTSYNVGTNTVFYGVAYGSGYFVAVGYNSATSLSSCWYTTNPASGNWTEFAPFGATTNVGTYTVAYGEGWWCIATAARTAYIQGDPSGTWTVSTTLFSGGNPGAAQHLIYSAGTWLLGTGQGANNWFTTSSPNTGWGTTDSASTNDWEWLYHNGQHWMAVGGSGGVGGKAWYASSVTSGAWTEITYPASWSTADALTAIMYDEYTSLWWIGSVEGGAGQQVASASTPGGTWTRQVDPWDATSYSLGGSRHHKGKFQMLGLTDGYIVWNFNSSILESNVRTGDNTVAASSVAGVGTVGSPTVIVPNPNATVTPSVVAGVATVGSPALNPLPTAHLLRNTFENGSNGTTLTGLLSSYAGDQFSQVTDVAGNTITYDTSTFANGTRSIKINTTSNAYFWWKDFDLGSAPFSTSYVRFYLRMDANPSSVRRIFQIDDSTAATSAAIAITTTGTVRVINGTGNDQVTTNSIPLGSWCRIELKVIHSTTAGSSELRLYNTPHSLTATETKTSTGTNYGSNGNQFRFGNTANVTQLLWLDDVAIAPTDWIQTSSTAGTVLDRWQGAVTDTTAAITFNTLSITSARVGYSTNSNLTSPSYTAYQSTAANGITRFNLSGLTADTTYYFFLEDSTGQKYHDANSKGSLKTFPTPGTQTNFTVAFGGCATSLSTSDAWYGAASHGARFFMHTGDIHYEDVASNSDTLVRDSWRVATKKQAVRQALRDMPMDYIFDDHDAGGNSVDLNTVTLPAVHNLYRERVPYYTLPASDTANHTFVLGRVRFIVLDCRSKRSPTGNTDNSSKTVLGSTQKTWLFDTLSAATEKAIVIVSSIVWHATATGVDSWGAYTTERTEIVNYITSNNIKGVMFMCGDSHMVAADNGTNAPGGFPVVLAAPMSNTGTVKGGATWSQSTYPTADDAGSTYRQYGLLSFTDSGNAVSISFTGRDYANSTDRITMSKLLWGDATVSATAVAGVATIGQVVTPQFPSTVAGVGTVGAPTVTTGSSNADVSPSIVAAVATIPTPALFMTEQADTVAGVGTVGAPTLLTSVTISPSVVAGVGTVPSPNLTMVEQADTVSAVGTVGAPTLSTSITVAAAVVSGVASVGTGRVAPVANLTTVAGVGTVGAPTLLTSVTIAASVVAGVGTIPAPNIPATEQADTVAGVGTVGTPTLLTSVTIAASLVSGVGTVGTARVAPVANLTTVAGVATIPAPNVPATEQADTVSAVGTVGTPTLSAGSTVSPSVVAGVGTVGTAMVAPVANLTTVTGVGTVGAPTLLTSVTIAASVVAGVGTVGAPNLPATEQADTVAGVGTVGTPTLLTSVTIGASVVAGVGIVGTARVAPVANLASVAGVGTVGAPTVLASSTISATVVAGSATVGAPNIPATEQADTVAAVATIGSPTLLTSVTIAASNVSGTATVGSGLIAPVANLTTVSGVASIPAPTVQTAANATVSASLISAVATVGGVGLSTIEQADLVAAVATVGTPTLQASSTVSAAVVAGVATVAGGRVSPVANLTTVAGVGTVGAPTLSASSTVTPSVVAGVATVGSATFTSSVAITPTVVAAVGTVGSPTVLASVTISATTVAGVGTVGTGRVQPVAGSATVAGVATVGVATPQTSSTVSAALVSGVASVPSAGLALTEQADTVGATATVGVPTLSTSVQLSPSVVSAVASVWSARVAPAQGGVVSGVATVGAPTLSTSVTITAGVVSGVASVGSPTFTSSATASPTRVDGVATVGSATLSTGSTVSATVVTGVATVGAPSVQTQGNVNIAAARVSAVATVGAPTVAASVTVGASVVAGSGTVAAPSLSTSSTVTGVVVQASTSIPAATESGSALATPATVATTATVGTPTFTSSASITSTLIAGAASVASPALLATASGGVVGAVASIGSPTVQASSLVSPSTVSAAATVGASTESTGVLITPTGLTLSATIPGGTASSDTSGLGGTVSFGAVAIQAGSTTSPPILTVTATVAVPTVAAGSAPTLTPVQVTASIPLPTIFAGSSPQVGTVPGSTTIATPMIAGATVIYAALLEAVASVNPVTVTTRRTPFRGWGVPIR